MTIAKCITDDTKLPSKSHQGQPPNEALSRCWYITLALLIIASFYNSNIKWKIYNHERYICKPAEVHCSSSLSRLSVLERSGSSRFNKGEKGLKQIYHWKAKTSYLMTSSSQDGRYHRYQFSNTGGLSYCNERSMIYLSIKKYEELRRTEQIIKHE